MSFMATNVIIITISVPTAHNARHRFYTEPRICFCRYLNGYVNFIRFWISGAEQKKDSRNAWVCRTHLWMRDVTKHGMVKKWHWWLSHKYTYVTHRRRTIWKKKWTGRVPWPKYRHKAQPSAAATVAHVFGKCRLCHSLFSRTHAPHAT